MCKKLIILEDLSAKRSDPSGGVGLLRERNPPIAEGLHESKEPTWQGWIRRLLNVNMKKKSSLSMPPHLKGKEGLTAAQRKVTERRQELVNVDSGSSQWSSKTQDATLGKRS